MAVHTLKPDGFIGNNRIQISRRWKATKPPCLLIPATTQYPFACRIGGGIGGYLCLGLFERARVRQVERGQLKPKTHDMAVRIDQAGNDRFTFGVKTVVRSFRPFVAGLKRACDFAINRDDQAIKAREFARFVKRDSVHIVDQAVGISGGGD